ncbi:hypothetical protein FSARC_14822 [Fusarium sarcochroum]|uniref:Uncharacterized protein n=1 Tax=Fusarium sarcochroum TaxID=1208366 RepID=A0A8H4SQC0_9HYPO|nr:hypothetical protein FSARC_14822 [Fusarium sarcochroum]
MSSPSNGIAPSDRMPMPGGTLQVEMLEALAKPKSIYEFCSQLPYLSDALKKDPVLQTKKFPRMVLLLHSIDRTALHAIVAGTVAYSAFTGMSTWLKTPDEMEGKVPGVYVIGLARLGELGRFLNILETLKLIDGLERYIKGARLCKTRQSFGSMNSAETELVKWVGEVDLFGGSAIVSGTIPSPQCIQSDAEFPKIEAVIDMFKRCCNWNLDPTGKVRQIQSPLYVGCSKDLRTRTSAYKRTARGGLANVNKPLCLVVNTLEALKLPVDLSVQIAVRTWDGIPLPVAERLVTTVACSFVYQHGFNAIEAGGTGPPKPDGGVLEKSAELLLGFKDTFRENLANTLIEIEERTEFMDNLANSINRVPDLIQRADDLAQREPQLHGATAQQNIQALKDKHEQLCGKREQLIREARLHQFAIDITEMLLGKRKVGDSSQ